MKTAYRSLTAGLLALLSAGAVASSMDDANQEGVAAGKAGTITSTADPNAYFDNYSANPPQSSYYQGGTQTSTDLAAKGQSELTTSDLGQTAQQAYVNNPADSISADSDMIKYSDSVRSNAESLTGLTSGQCTEQQLNKTTYTTHSCQMANNLTQTCTRDATIGTTGARETYDTQLTFSLTGMTGTRVADYWIEYDFTVPDDGTISGGSWVFTMPSSPNDHESGSDFQYTVKVLGQTFTTTFNSSTTINIPAQQVTKGQVIPVLIRHTNGTREDAAANTLLNNFKTGSFTAVATLPLEAVRDTVQAGLQWTDSCPDGMGDAVKMSETCTDPGGTRSVVVGGQTYSVYSDCWQYTTLWQVNEDDTNTCQTYIDDPNCSEGTRTCTQKIGDYCVMQNMTYQCASTVTSTGYLCGTQFYCSDGSCASMEAGTNGNFSEAVSQLAALAAAGKDFAGMDPDTVSAFTGKAMACRKSAAGFSNCCKSSGWGQDVGLAHCNTEEKEIGTAKEKKLVVDVGSYCAKKVLGVCLEKKESYCVFDSKLARIVQDQGRRGQLGISFGSASSPDCRGLKVTELQDVKFDQLDFSDFYDDLNSNVSLPDQSALTERIQSDIKNSLNTTGG
ncbi:type-F conjugative transfer system mating-pair stabilization protein TraN [Candidatus Pantoea multigeneris]|uniref:Type-F conjugative transfer system mating-pair stabilization protein TraN n=1 Tax=Candidatus Pantoea multigeneris TaxID=2608357 RepID=A0ABX0REZ7_9GAMM|nr:type-F conjugative transfer system mating-pair stabilization protein TraN [Pantoea multigeneris]NIF23925.1 type-F conjugative transfer system mating-pair stabilization protein TraN [Pantoea multigeneris]